MNTNALLIVTFGGALVISGPVLAKGKGQDKHLSQSRMENSNQQSQEDSRRGRERAGERQEMHDQEGYGQPSYRIENPVDNLNDKSADQLRQDLDRRGTDGINQNLPGSAPTQQRKR